MKCRKTTQLIIGFSVIAVVSGDVFQRPLQTQSATMLSGERHTQLAPPMGVGGIHRSNGTRSCRYCEHNPNPLFSGCNVPQELTNEEIDQEAGEVRCCCCCAHAAAPYVACCSFFYNCHKVHENRHAAFTLMCLALHTAHAA